MIKSIRLQNIRTFDDSSFVFEPGINLIIGRNGSGKTTILESIGMLGFGKYMSIAQDAFAIGPNSEAGRIEAELELDERRRVEIGFSAKEKIIQINQSKVPVSVLIGLQPQIFFNPETVELVFDSPALRRRELDMVSTQTDHAFVIDILSFRKILKERNAVLRMIAHNKSKLAELDFWDKRFIEFSNRIYQKRRALIDFFNGRIGELFTSLSMKEGTLELKYLPSGDYERFEEVLAAHLESDLETGATSIGPHRDDFGFVYDSKPMRQGSSRGEQRLAAVAFKAVASEFLIERGIDPIIILDDVFSELDHARQDAVAETLGLFKVRQVFISATDDKMVPEVLFQNANIIKLG